LKIENGALLLANAIAPPLEPEEDVEKVDEMIPLVTAEVPATLIAPPMAPDNEVVKVHQVTLSVPLAYDTTLTAPPFPAVADDVVNVDEVRVVTTEPKLLIPIAPPWIPLVDAAKLKDDMSRCEDCWSK